MSPKSFVKIGSVTAEILLIGTNVASTKFAWTNVNLMFPGICLLSLIKIGSVTAEIFLIWTNVAKTNVVWKNVVVTAAICWVCSQDPLFKV